MTEILAVQPSALGRIPWCSHPNCHDRVHGDSVHTDENGGHFRA